MEHVRLSTDVPVGCYHKVHGLPCPGVLDLPLKFFCNLGALLTMTAIPISQDINTSSTIASREHSEPTGL
jgi:hypothetical protein